MQSNTRDAVRRSPRQERSRAKVEAILSAVEQIAADDPADLTTSIIAERAGISVGSLYQYFENREDIVDRLLERYRRLVEELMDKTFADVTVSTLHEGVGLVLERYIRFVRSHDAFRALWYSPEFANPHRMVVDPEHHALTRAFADAAYAHGVLDTVGEDVSIEELHLDLYACWTAVDALVHAAFRLDDRGDDAILARAARLPAALRAGAAA